jgi:hypothetical protein
MMGCQIKECVAQMKLGRYLFVICALFIFGCEIAPKEVKFQPDEEEVTSENPAPLVIDKAHEAPTK